MKVLITGGAGQLARELSARAPAGTVVTAPARSALDVTDASAVKRAVKRAAPDLVINAAGYTAVNRAESEAAHAAAVNVQGAENVAAAAAENGARVIYFSTDYVFDGTASIPYAEDAAPNPVNVYGRTKLEGEQRVAAAAGDKALIVRASWVYSRHGRNFFSNMLQFMGAGREVRVVADQVGTPTWAGSLAGATWAFARRP
jgi:dTDP-4-dehydrorhamnose reductase